MGLGTVVGVAVPFVVGGAVRGALDFAQSVLGGKRTSPQGPFGQVFRGIDPGTSQGAMIPTGAPNIDIQSQGFPPGTKMEVDPATGEIKIIKRRRRRRRLLTCADKADIAFVTGTLGKGQMGQAAVTTLLSRCT